MEKQNPGFLVVVGGVDGSGKSTQVNLILQRLLASGRRAALIHFPNYNSPTGEFIKKEYLGGNLGTLAEVGAYPASLLYALDRWAAGKKIKEMLAEGFVVMLDRYVESNLAFQGGKIDEPDARHEFYERIENLEYEWLKIPRPDLNLILHISAQTSAMLRGKRYQEQLLDIADAGKPAVDIHEADLVYLKKIEQIYLEIAARPHYKLLECEQGGQLLSIEAINEMIWGEIQKILG